MSINKRYHGMDLARAVFMVAGVFFHAAFIYKLNPSWLAREHQGDIFFNHLISFMGDFRMFAFYLISGFFFSLVFQKYGSIKTFTSRLIRFGIPMILIGLTLNPYVDYLSEYGHFESNIEYFIYGEWLGHLWFLGNLIVYMSLSVLFFSIVNIKKIFIKNKFLFLLIIFVLTPTISGLLSCYSGFEIGERFVFVSFYKLFKYIPYYVLGIFLFMNQSSMLEVIKLKYGFVYFAIYIVMKTNISVPVEYFLASKQEYAIFIFLSYMNIFIVLASISLLQALATNSNILSSFVESSYTVYLLHYPLLFLFYQMISMLTIGIFEQYIVLCLTVFLFIHYFHHIVVKNNKTLKFILNGIKS